MTKATPEQIAANLRDVAHLMPDGGPADAMSEVLAGIAIGAASAIETLIAERDDARGMVRDILWMAGRYADGRRTYAVAMYNDARGKAERGGFGGDAKPAVDGDEPDRVTLTERVDAAEAKATRLRNLLMSRPANNAALPQSYIEWNSRMYLVDGDGFLREPEELLAAMKRRAAE